MCQTKGISFFWIPLSPKVSRHFPIHTRTHQHTRTSRIFYIFAVPPTRYISKVTLHCNRHIMLDLPTIKTDFLFENSQNFNQTTHARPQHPIVFIHNISLYFNCISSVKYLFKRSRHGHVMPFSDLRPKHPPQKKSETREKY